MSLLDRRLLFDTGKGGVGKSTVTAALALVAAARGKRVLVCEVNTHERISSLLGARPVGTEIRPVAPNVEAVVVRPQEAMRQYAMMQLRYRAVYRAVFENRFVARLLRFIPSLPELVMLGKILHHVREERWDLVLVDAPATGHGLTFLRVPQALLDTIPPGQMRSEAEWMQALLADPEATAINLVSLPEELPVNETIELARAIRHTLRLHPGTVFLNRAWQRRFDEAELRALDRMLEPPTLDAAANAARAHSIRAALTDRYRRKLQRELGLPLLEIPFIAPQGDFGRPAIDRVAEILAGAEGL